MLLCFALVAGRCQPQDSLLSICSLTRKPSPIDSQLSTTPDSLGVVQRDASGWSHVSHGLCAASAQDDGFSQFSNSRKEKPCYFVPLNPGTVVLSHFRHFKQTHQSIGYIQGMDSISPPHLSSDWSRLASNLRPSLLRVLSDCCPLFIILVLHFKCFLGLTVLWKWARGNEFDVGHQGHESQSHMDFVAELRHTDEPKSYFTFSAILVFGFSHFGIRSPCPCSAV